jgi:cell division control protein 6
MITNARVLQADWVPREIVHRNPEKNLLQTALQPVADGGRPEDALITGPSGAGKTCLARYSLQQIEEERLDIHTKHVDCWAASKPFRVLLELLDPVAPTHDIHRTTARDTMLSRLRDVDAPYLVVLDEADQLGDPGLLGELYSIPKLTLVLVTNDEQSLSGLFDERLRSRFRSGVHVHCDSYSLDTLVSILNRRARGALEPGAVERPQLERIADAAAGDARRAISILRRAARRAMDDEAGVIDGSHITPAIPEAAREQRQADLERLNDHQRAVYAVLANADGGAAPKAVYEEYTQRVSSPKTKRTVRDYLGKLQSYNLATATGEGPARRYHVVEIDSPDADEGES